MLEIADFQQGKHGNLRVFVKLSNFEKFLYYLAHSIQNHEEQIQNHEEQNQILEEHAVLQEIAGLCLLHKALRQAALDGGRWRTASRLLCPDPAARPEFGGDFRVLAAIGSFQRALAELRTGVAPRGPGVPPQATPPRDPPVDGGADEEGAAGCAQAKGKAKAQRPPKKDP